MCKLELSSLSHYLAQNTFLLIHDYASRNLMYSLLTLVLVCLVLNNSAYVYIYIIVHILQNIFYIFVSEYV